MVGERFKKLENISRAFAYQRIRLDESIVPLEACPARTPSLWPGPGMGSCEHDARRCIAEWEDRNPLVQPLQTRTERVHQTAAAQWSKTVPISRTQLAAREARV